MEDKYESTIFAIAQTDSTITKDTNEGCTLRITICPNIDVESFVIEFSNLTSEEPILIGQSTLALGKEDGTLDFSTTVPVTVEGKTSFFIKQGCELLSDKVDLSIHAGEYLILNLYYPEGQKITAGNWISKHSERSVKGNYSVDKNFVIAKPKARLKQMAKAVMITDFTVLTSSVFQIIGYVNKPKRLVACFGDSITQQCAWTAPFEKILSLAYPTEISVVNLGIGGNRLLHDGSPKYERHGLAGIKRFRHDLLKLKGLTHVIIGIGSNDIGLPGSSEAPAYEMITLQEYVLGMQEIAKSLHNQGIKVYASTILPRQINKIFTPEREELRQKMNSWIRQASCFDAVIDFDKVLATQLAKDKRAKDSLYLLDRLHPSIKGGLLMARSIDISLFKE